ncbi:MAG: SPASM domain-containing protein, partial [Planctomycetota bacterium]
RRGLSAPRLQVNSTVTGSNCHCLGEIVPIAARLGAFKHVFSHLWFWTAEMATVHNKLYGDKWAAAAQNLGGLEGMDVDRLIDEVERVRSMDSPAEVEFLPEIDRQQIGTYYEKPEQVIKPRCRAPWMAIRVLPNGDVMPCFDLVLGNVRGESFGAIWRGAKMAEFRKALLEKGLFPACTRCCWLFSY